MVDLPPPVYDHEPRRPYIVIEMSERGVIRRCFGIRLACAIPKHRLIIMADTLRGAHRELILRHEKGHLNGWIHPARRHRRGFRVIKDPCGKRCLGDTDDFPR